MTNLSKLTKENAAIKDRIIRNIRKLFEHEQGYYKPVRVGNFWNNNCIEYKKKMVTAIKPYQSKNTLMKLSRT